MGIDRKVYKFALRRNRINTTRVVALGFLFIIIIGALLLTLPIASKDGQSVGFLDAAFTATSATCVTGLAIADTLTQWTIFGQIVILVLIQIGGLGFMTVMSLAFFLLNKRVGMQERYIMMQSFNLNDVEGIMAMMRHVLIGTFAFEGVGAVILSFCFYPRFGLAGGIYRGIFHSISAFCNAGFDILGGGESMASYNGNPVVLLTLSLLIIIGGLGFFVWEDIFRKKGKFKRFHLHTKIVLITSGVLIFGGMILFMLLETRSGGALENMGTGKQLLNAFFQSVTTRTAGFASFDQATLTPAGKVISSVLMMIGGSSGSTAGGIKTVTIAVVALSVGATIKGKKEIVINGRTISNDQILNAMALLIVAVIAAVIGGVLISVVDGFSIMDSMYEAISAYGTVGLSVGITSSLSVFSKLLVMLYMFFGRVGIMTVVIAFMMRSTGRGKMTYPVQRLMIG